ncbi:hypothetical protein M9H77_23771 [Catharanthus roseus]|uniref:Uncharacterized protein n=1 Tax=Catharanthus roseus TaxID=4058 RepID=A0ACC0AYE1_CATRO|nr:hypothetical protein M9H77_23771 [Catharanthus roseus]
MVASIGKVFPKTRHRLCIWHIGKNSKKYIMGLRSKEDFFKLFNYVLKDIDTISEFDAYLYKYVCLHCLWGSSGVGGSVAGKVSKKDIVGSSVWRRNMLRKFSDLISASEWNINAWEYIEEEFRMMKDKIVTEVGTYFIDNLETKKIIVKIKCNKARGKRKSSLMHASRIKTTVQLSMKNEALGRIVNVPSSECQLNLRISNSRDGEPSNSLQQFINFM